MSVAAQLDALDGRPTDSRSLGAWGVALAIATEATLFAVLIASYFYLRVNARTWPPAGSRPPELTLALPGTAVLIASSVVLVWSDRQAARERWSRSRVGIAVTLALGAAFLVVQGFEIASRPEGVRDSAQSTALYTITGLHAAHVVVGMALLLFLLLRMGPAPARRAPGPVASRYWHFVDVIWVVVVISLYLSERW